MKPISTFVFLSLIAASTALFAAGPAMAADKSAAPSCPAPHIDWRNYEWTLITGKGKTACEEMLIFLRSRPKKSPPPVCLDERLPPNGNWTKPTWTTLNGEQKAALLRDTTERLKATGRDKSLVEDLQRAKEWRITRMDITGDGVPETVLAYGNGSANCRKAARCAVAKGDLKGTIAISYADGGDMALVPMLESEEKIDFDDIHRRPMISFGELIFYKGRPYWLSPVNWLQIIHDDYKKTGKAGANPKRADSQIFQLAPILSRNHQYAYRKKMDFKEVAEMIPDPNATCHFGYFHSMNLKRTRNRGQTTFLN